MNEDAVVTEPRYSGWWRPLALVGGIVLLLILARVFGVGQRLMMLREWIAGLGMLGPAAFVLIYTSAVVAAVPGSAITVAAGAIFGSVLGVVVVSVGSTLGAALAFLIARYFAREPAARWLAKAERFQKLDEMTERHGAIIVAITRLVPLFPFNLLNYGFGMTRVRFSTYVFWSWLCMLPGTILYVVGADALTRIAAEGRVPWSLVGAFAIVGLLLMVLVRLARRKLKEREARAT